MIQVLSDGKWLPGVVVKLIRAGISEKYRIKGLDLVLDNGRGAKKIEYPSPNLVLTAEKQEIRYWSSGTPCMRSSGFDHARPTMEMQAAAAAVKKKRSGKRPEFSGNAVQRIAINKAEDRAKEILAGLGKKAKGAEPTTQQVLEMLQLMGDDWPTQTRPNVSRTGKEVPGMCLGVVNVLGGVGMEVSNVSQSRPNITKVLTRWVRASLPEPNFPFSSLQVRPA